MREELQWIENGVSSLDLRICVKNSVGKWLKTENQSK